MAYIKSTRSDTFDSVDEAYDDFSRMTLDAMADKESPEAAAAVERLRTWTDAHLVANPDAGNPDKKGLPQKAFKLDYPRIVTWAFLAWDAR